MLLTLTTTHTPATDLGFLLHKNPARVQSFPLAGGQAHLFYPVATPERCTVALLLEIDPVGLVRGGRGTSGDGFGLASYVTDRPYAASSFLSVAIAELFGSALAGRCKERPELVETALPLVAHLAVVPCRGGEGLLHRLFEPLGYTVRTTPHAMDETLPDLGNSPYFTVDLSATVRLRELLAHLYVLVPVLDDHKHYWVGEAEVEKLLKRGEGWLPTHPERELITRRYLKHQRRLTEDALARLIEIEDATPPDEEEPERAEQGIERPLHLNEQRMTAVVETLRASGARRVLDLGCGSGQLLGHLLKERQFEEIVGMDVSHQVLARARERIARLPPMQQERVRLLQGSLTYRDARLVGYDAAAVVEVIEHLDPPRLAAFERVLFEAAHPATIVLTTPNADYNVRFPTLPAGHFRHTDHRFEWGRATFQSWASATAARHGYHVTFHPIGPEDAEVGAPTQLALFTQMSGISSQNGGE